MWIYLNHYYIYISYYNVHLHFTVLLRFVLESIYCEPRELLPYSTSWLSESDNVTTIRPTKTHCLHRQEMQLPAKPDESENCEMFVKNYRASPPPPYYPARSIQQSSSASKHAKAKYPTANLIPTTKYVNQSALNNIRPNSDGCYFMPLSDDEIDTEPIKISNLSCSEKPNLEMENAYLMPQTPSADILSSDASQTEGLKDMVVDLESKHLKPNCRIATDEQPDTVDDEKPDCTVDETMSALYAIRRLS